MLSRFPSRRDGLLFAGLTLASAILAVTSVAGSIAHVGKTFPGFFVWDNLVVVSLGRSDWTGVAAEIPFRARVLAVDGTAVTRRADLYAIVRASPDGTSHRYLLEGPDGTVERTVRSMRLTAVDYLVVMAPFVLNGLTFLVAGLAVFYLKPESRQSRAFLAFTFIWGVELILDPDLFTTGRFQALSLIAEALLPVAVLHQALSFPEPRWPVKASARPLAALYLLGLAIGLIEVWAFWHDVPLLLALNGGGWLAAAAAGVLTFGTVTYGALRGETPLARRRARLVLAGGSAAFLIPVLALFPIFLLDRAVSTSWLVVASFAFPVAIGYAVARHDLFEADRFVKLSVEYTVLTAVVALGYAATVLLAERMTAGLGLRRSPMFQVGFVLAALAMLIPLRSRVQHAIDRLFYRARVDYKAAVARVTERLATLLEERAVVEQVVTTISEVLFIDTTSVWERVGPRLVRRGVPAGVQPAELPSDDPGIAVFLTRGRRLSRDEVEESIHLRAVRTELLALFDELLAALLVPFTREGRCAGFLGVGPKASGGPLSADDIDVLDTLATQTGIALATASAVEERRAALEELRRSEQLAALGELATSVAHAIRNPLAGIRLAAQLGLEATPATGAVREEFDDILTEVDKLESQIRGVLDFVRPFEPKREPVALPALADAILRTLGPRLEQAGITSVVAVAADVPPVLADPAHLSQALQEIVVNACDAMPTGGRLTITAARNGRGGERDQVRITVSDTGPGIAPDQRERVFRLFVTTKATGTGVGLAAVKKIIERHGGSVAIEPVAPTGTAFVILLPAAR